MTIRTTTYSALAAAVALACGTTLHAQQEGFETEERIEATEQRAEQQRENVAELEQAEDANESEDMAARRAELVQNADQALAELREQDSSAGEVIDEAYGHAVFDTTKGGFIVTGAGGTGVARPSEGSEVTFMHLGQAGIGLGAGLENYKLVLLFEDEQTYSDFVSGQWDGNIAAQAAAGTEGAAAEEQFIEGVRAYRLTDGGLMAQVDVSGTRFWPSDRLNEAPTVQNEQFAAQGAGGQTSSQSDSQSRQSADTGQSNPELIDELASERDDLATFVEAIKAAGLEDSLTGDTAYTVFAPTDEAFESMSGMQRDELLAPENREQLISLLRAHIVADDLDREMARNIPEAQTIDGGTVNLDVENDQLTVGDANVVEPDIQRGNLRVHVVDSVLSSGSATQVASAAGQASAEASEATEETSESVASAADEASDEAAEATEETSEAVASAADEASDEAAEATEETSEAVASAADEASDEAAEASEEFSEEVQEADEQVATGEDETDLR